MNNFKYLRLLLLPVVTLAFLLLPTQGLLAQGCSFDVSSYPTHVKCHGEATGHIRLAARPAGSYRYLWSTGETTDQIGNLEAGTYFVKVTDHTGCEVISFITIEEPDKLEFDATVEHPVCYNENSGRIELRVSGGVAPYSYSWSNNVEKATNPDLFSGSYECLVRDADHCSLKASFELQQPEKISTSAAIRDVSGYGLSDGSVNISCSGGVHPYHYHWSNAAGFTGQTEDIYEVPASSYELHITDSRSCSYDTSLLVSQPPPLSLEARITDVFCNAYSDGVIDVMVSGGVPPYRYSWANEQIILTEESSRLGNCAVGYYYLIVTDHNGIDLVDSFYVDEPNAIVASVQVGDAWCYDSLSGSAELTVSGGMPPFSYLWSNGSRSKDIQGVHAGAYQVEIVDTKGCFLRVAAQIGEPDSIEINTEVQHVSCKDHYNGKIFTDVCGGLPPYSYSWSNGGEGASIEQLSIGNYSVTVRDSHDCPMSTTETITRPLNGCISIPNAFTPNGDHLNDQWVIENSYLYPGIEVIVMNQEGYLVFESKGYQTPWDGTYNGNDVAPGTFYYVVDLHNGDEVYKGLVTIIR